MKLLSLTNRYYFILTFSVLLLGAGAGYQILKSTINRDFDHKLQAEKKQLIYELHTFEELEKSYYLNIGDIIQLVPYEGNPNSEDILTDTIMYDRFEERDVNYRQLQFVDQVHGDYYLITITKSLLTTEDLVRAIGEILLILITGMLLILLVMNRIISKKLWSPFYQTINEMTHFKISKPHNLQPLNTKIAEFLELHSVIQEMIAKSQRDYLILKQFTENAAHEIQTPLAIIKAKSEVLLQATNLSQEQMINIDRIYESASRLSKLKHGLTLLSKIENDQFPENEPIDLRKLLKQKLHEINELIEFKNLRIRENLNASPTIIINPILADILLVNLISNAIKHNVDNGEIRVTLNENELIISNTGKSINSDPEQLFYRFKKGYSSSDSPGLGLSLVKHICEIYNFKVHYILKGDIHKIAILF